jgi:phosphomannomutase
MGGKICVAFSVSPKVETLAKHFNLPFEVVKIGFKYVCETMLKEDVLLGGEESGGIAIKGHLPERDGIWIGLVIWEYMAKTGKTLEQLIAEVYSIVGSFAYERSDLHLSENLKQDILDKCRRDSFSAFGKFRIAKTETTDGYKYFFENGDWLMIRASGTEPVLRTYAESSSKEKALEILKAGKLTLTGKN